MHQPVPQDEDDIQLKSPEGMDELGNHGRVRFANESHGEERLDVDDDYRRESQASALEGAHAHEPREHL